MPAFYPLNFQDVVANNTLSGEFAWVGAGNLADLTNFYQNLTPKLPGFIAGAYSGFKDFYKQGGGGNTLFLIDHNGTATLQSTLDLARNSGINYLQLITWNDYGEGTMIEPTMEFSFSFLQTIQQYTGVSYTVTELQLIDQWYTLRKKYKGNAAVEQQLTQAYNDLVALKVDNATAIISAIN